MLLAVAQASRLCTLRFHCMTPAHDPLKHSVFTPEILAENLVKAFGDQTVLHGISLTVNRGDIVAIVGGSGTGKTVLLDHLTGLIKPDTGRVLVADHHQPHVPLVDLASLDDERLDDIRLSWAIVFQRNALFTGTVYENIALWLREHTMLAEDQITQRVRESLAAVSLDVDTVITKQREALSGGMAKRVAIARAIAVDPIVTFFDEPTTGLDPVVSNHIIDLIWKGHHRPREDHSLRTTVIVTHDRELLRRVAPRVIMLGAGVVAFDGTYEQFTKSTVPAAVEYLTLMPTLHARSRD